MDDTNATEKSVETSVDVNVEKKVDTFNHPYTPYDVQLEFMQTVYDILEKGDGQVGILESPTGTVSTLLKPLVTSISPPPPTPPACAPVVAAPMTVAKVH
jgi:hypothetical protein